MGKNRFSLKFDHREVVVIFSLFVFVSLLMFTVGIVVGKGLTLAKYEGKLARLAGSSDPVMEEVDRILAESDEPPTSGTHITTPSGASDLDATKDYFIIPEPGGAIKRLTLSGILNDTLSAPAGVFAVSKIDETTNNFFAATATEVYGYNGSFINLGIAPPTTLSNIRYLPPYLFVLFDSGQIIRLEVDTTTMDVLSSNFYDFGISETLTDMYSNWITCSAGKLIKWEGTVVASSVYTLSSEGYDLNAIDGLNDDFIILVGNGGMMYKYDGEEWSRVGTPPIKDWKSVSVLSGTEVYIFG